MIRAEDIVAFLSAEAAPELLCPGGMQSVIRRPAVVGQPAEDAVIFLGLAVREPLEKMRASHPGLAIVDSHLRSRLLPHLNGGVASVIIWSSDPRLDFCRVLERFFAPVRTEGIDPSAVISPGAVIGRGCSIGPGCFISEGVEIGDDCLLHGRVFLYPGTRMGNRVIIHAGAVIGADGFGFHKRPDGSWQKFPHLGGVVIGDDVEIGANSTIDRGALVDTVVERGVKIDNLVHIAHNSRIGADSLIIAGAVICGGVRIGERTWVAPQAVIREEVSVGRDAVIGMGAVVQSDTEARAVMTGWQSRPALGAKRISAFLQRVADTDPRG